MDFTKVNVLGIWIYSCMLWLSDVRIQAFKYGHVIKLCENYTLNDVNEPIAFVNLDFPSSSVADRTCSCSFVARYYNLKLMPVNLYSLLLSDGDRRTPALQLTVNNNKSFLIEHFEQLQRHVNTSIGKLDLRLTSTGRLGQSTSFSFMLVISTENMTHVKSQNDVIDIACFVGVADRNYVTNDVTEQVTITSATSLERIASVELVIILGSVCAALLIIVAIVSIMLCCVMPKKQKKKIKQIRDSVMLLDADIPRVQHDKVSPVYSNANGEHVCRPSPVPEARDTLDVRATYYSEGSFDLDTSAYQNIDFTST